MDNLKHHRCDIMDPDAYEERARESAFKVKLVPCFEELTRDVVTSEYMQQFELRRKSMT